jgi:predicted DsbA family dithiol-disulfide isomerase
VLLDVAAGAGLDREEFDRRWRDDLPGLVEAVRTDHNEAVESGITGVPAVVVNGEYLLTGALEVAQYRKVVARLGGGLR